MQVPDPALVLLVGASGAGKSTWAAAGAVRASKAARDRPVPAGVLNGQLRQMRDVGAELEPDGWAVHVVSTDEPAPAAAPRGDAEKPNGRLPAARVIEKLRASLW